MLFLHSEQDSRLLVYTKNTQYARSVCSGTAGKTGSARRPSPLDMKLTVGVRVGSTRKVGARRWHKQKAPDPALHFFLHHCCTPGPTKGSSCSRSSSPSPGKSGSMRKGVSMLRHSLISAAMCLFLMAVQSLSGSLRHVQMRPKGYVKIQEARQNSQKTEQGSLLRQVMESMQSVAERLGDDHTNDAKLFAALSSTCVKEHSRLSKAAAWSISIDGLDQGGKIAQKEGLCCTEDHPLCGNGANGCPKGVCCKRPQPDLPMYSPVCARRNSTICGGSFWGFTSTNSNNDANSKDIEMTCCKATTPICGGTGSCPKGQCCSSDEIDAVPVIMKCPPISPILCPATRLSPDGRCCPKHLPICGSMATLTTCPPGRCCEANDDKEAESAESKGPISEEDESVDKDYTSENPLIRKCVGKTIHEEVSAAISRVSRESGSEQALRSLTFARESLKNRREQCRVHIQVEATTQALHLAETDEEKEDYRSQLGQLARKMRRLRDIQSARRRVLTARVR